MARLCAIDRFGQAVPMIAFPVRYSALAFFIVACLARVGLQNLVESRYQILTYCMIAAAFEILAYTLSGGASALRGLLDAIAGTAGVLFVQLVIEG
jgi:hypothetical protein